MRYAATLVLGAAIEPRKSEVQGYPQLSGEFEASLV